MRSAPVAKRLKPATLSLYLGFWATGVAVALPGALLPALAARWHLHDEQSGRLFLMAWLGSSVGALLVRGSLRRTLLLGSSATALAAAGMGLSGGRNVEGLMALYGCGLGTTMTSISLIRHQQAEGSGTEMVRLNLVWAVGACLSPSLTVRVLSGGDFSPLLYEVAGWFSALGLAAWMQPELRMPRAVAGLRSGSLSRAPLGLLAMIFIITGVEASAGGWLTTYAHRGGPGVGQAVAAPICFWAGLLLSRLFWSARVGWLSESQVVRASLTLMAGSAVLLVLTSHGALLLGAAFCLGFGIGPTYPLLLGWALRFARGPAVFFIAGIGSACLPWMTGLVSTERGSLRMGLMVPMLGTLLMLSVALLPALRRWSVHSPVDRG